MKNITLREMFNTLIECILNKEELPIFYWRREFEEGHPEFLEITEVDLLRGRFKTIDDDFSEFEWELENSNIYMLENKSN